MLVVRIYFPSYWFCIISHERIRFILLWGQNFHFLWVNYPDFMYSDSFMKN